MSLSQVSESYFFFIWPVALVLEICQGSQLSPFCSSVTITTKPMLETTDLVIIIDCNYDDSSNF